MYATVALLIGGLSSTLAMPTVGPPTYATNTEKYLNGIRAAVAASTRDECSVLSRMALTLSSNQSTKNYFVKGGVMIRQTMLCLHSIPFSQVIATRTLNFVEPLLQFYGQIDDLIDPPEDYLGKAVDLKAEILAIKAKAQGADGFTSMIDFSMQMRRVLHQVKDDHFSYDIPLLNEYFAYYLSGHSLVSFSEDDLTHPRLYLGKEDFIEETDWRRVLEIDGIDANDYIIKKSWEQGMFDPDSSYNEMMTSLPAVSYRSHTGMFSHDFFSDGISPEFSIITVGRDSKDGTKEIKIEPTVQIRIDLAKFTDVNSYLKHMKTRPMNNRASKTISSDELTAKARAQYPKAQLNIPDVLTGFFLPDQSDTAVITLQTLIANDMGTTVFEISDNFISQVQDFLKKCRAAGKTKMIVDLRHMTGGQTLLAHPLLALLLGKNDMISRISYRRDSGLTSIIPFYETVSPSRASSVKTDLLVPFAILNHFDPDKILLPNWKEKFQGDEPRNSQGLYFELPWTSLRNYQWPQYFVPNNVAFVTDGVCSSICHEMTNLVIDMGVAPIVAFGGRPNGNLPMQAAGGTATGSVLTYDKYSESIKALIQQNPAAKRPLFQAVIDKKIPSFTSGFQFITTLQTLHIIRDGARVNAHMSYNAAHCRRYYEERMISDPAEVYKTAYQVVWDTGRCVHDANRNSQGLLTSQRPKYTPAVRGTGPWA